MLDRRPGFQLALAIRDAVDAVAEVVSLARQANQWPETLASDDHRQAQTDVQRCLVRLIYVRCLLEAGGSRR